MAVYRKCEDITGKILYFYPPEGAAAIYKFREVKRLFRNFEFYRFLKPDKVINADNLVVLVKI